MLAGTNDIGGNVGPMTLEATENYLMSMVDIARANDIRIVLSSLLPVCDYIKPQTAQRPPEKILALNRWLKDYAGKNRFVYLDYFSAMVDDNGMLRREADQRRPASQRRGLRGDDAAGGEGHRLCAGTVGAQWGETSIGAGNRSVTVVAPKGPSEPRRLGVVGSLVQLSSNEA